MFYVNRQTVRMKTIYLDIDGVCTNFIEACIKANGFNSDEVLKLWKNEYRGEFRAFKVLGISNKVFWKNIETTGEEFWSNMEPYPWFLDLYKKLNEIGKVHFLSSPSMAPNSLSGKLKWLQKYFGRDFRDYIITPNKELLAHKNAYLIDDYPRNVEKFKESGGNGILFPQYWNTKEIINDKIEYVLSIIKNI